MDLVELLKITQSNTPQWVTTARTAITLQDMEGKMRLIFTDNITDLMEGEDSSYISINARKDIHVPYTIEQLMKILKLENKKEE